MRTIQRAALPAALALVCSGCLLTPTYRKPTVPPPATYKEESAGGEGVQWKLGNPSDALPRGKWWEIFQDARLNALEEKISITNETIKVAEAQFRQARALVALNVAGFFPNVTTAPQITRQRSFSSSGNYSYQNNFNLPVTATWEPDLWGAITTSVIGAKDAAQASAAQLEGARLSIHATLASDYFTLESVDTEIALLQSAATSYADALELTKTRFKSGVASQIDVLQAQAQLDSTVAQAEDLSVTRSQIEHAIAVLIGESPSSFSLSTATLQGAPPAVPVALPTHLLERRPDVAAAERQLAAANENIGLARAAYFPLVSLTATAGYESNHWTKWLLWPSRVWSIGASAAGTVFDFGRHYAQNREAWAAYDAAAASYRQTVLTAFQNVEDDLAALSHLAQEADHEDSAAKAADNSLKLEIARYKAGIDSYFNVITAQNTALTNERAAVQILGRRMTTAVALISATGGGWDATQLPSGLWTLSSNADPAPPAAVKPVTPPAAPAKSATPPTTPSSTPPPAPQK